MRPYTLSVPIALMTAFSILNLPITVTGISATSFAKRSGNFSITCGSVSFNYGTWTLYATCNNEQSKVFDTSKRLDDCLANGAGGYVVCQPKYGCSG